MGWRDYLVLLWGALAICAAVFFTSLFLAACARDALAGWTDDQEAELQFQCQQKVWELRLPTDQLIAGELTEDECKYLRGQLQPQTPLLPLICQWKYACRQEL